MANLCIIDGNYRDGTASLMRNNDNIQVEAEVSSDIYSPYVIAKDFFLEVSRGNITGMSSINKYGKATNCDNGIITDVWDRANSTDDQDIWVAPTQARVHQIVSSSTDDASGGLGARTLRIYGLTSWSTKETSEDITMNGTTNVATSNSYVIIYRMQVLTKGSSGPNVGTITATADTDSTVTAQIEATNGQTLMCIFAIPSIQTAYIPSMQFSLIKNASAEAEVRLVVNPEPDAELTGFIVKHIRGIQGAGTSYVESNFGAPIKIIGPAIVKLQADASSNNVNVSGSLSILIEDN